MWRPPGGPGSGSETAGRSSFLRPTSVEGPAVAVPLAALPPRTGRMLGFDTCTIPSIGLAYDMTMSRVSPCPRHCLFKHAKHAFRSRCADAQRHGASRVWGARISATLCGYRVHRWWTRLRSYHIDISRDGRSRRRSQPQSAPPDLTKPGTRKTQKCIPPWRTISVKLILAHRLAYASRWRAAIGASWPPPDQRQKATPRIDGARPSPEVPKTLRARWPV